MLHTLIAKSSYFPQSTLFHGLVYFSFSFNSLFQFQSNKTAYYFVYQNVAEKFYSQPSLRFYSILSNKTIRKYCHVKYAGFLRRMLKHKRRPWCWVDIVFLFDLELFDSLTKLIDSGCDVNRRHSVLAVPFF